MKRGLRRLFVVLALGAGIVSGLFEVNELSTREMRMLNGCYTIRDLSLKLDTGSLSSVQGELEACIEEAKKSRTPPSKLLRNGILVAGIVFVVTFLPLEFLRFVVSWIVSGFKTGAALIVLLLLAGGASAEDNFSRCLRGSSRCDPAKLTVSQFSLVDWSRFAYPPLPRWHRRIHAEPLWIPESSLWIPPPITPLWTPPPITPLWIPHRGGLHLGGERDPLPPPQYLSTPSGVYSILETGPYTTIYGPDGVTSCFTIEDSGITHCY